MVQAYVVRVLVIMMLVLMVLAIGHFDVSFELVWASL